MMILYLITIGELEIGQPQKKYFADTHPVASDRSISVIVTKLIIYYSVCHILYVSMHRLSADWVRDYLHLYSSGKIG
jgi:hypothetical protein